ncbi:hypothetical protein BDY17DRAFT_23698 [Neohortaea acidophila]|uniref:Uncharacterized protein n=1 Tax=Neohortaea acidophila TaxID=245834 RepID=A0A6A6Q727_9PEZI|nr:uncharacterized protein BDY17DRAFT_23698 [Neohortaea acidophila]KAF2488092.1 hypothetical protein BDY17DRAFT_23698 [Neohortaea acidophila]
MARVSVSVNLVDASGSDTGAPPSPRARRRCTRRRARLRVEGGFWRSWRCSRRVTCRPLFQDGSVDVHKVGVGRRWGMLVTTLLLFVEGHELRVCLCSCSCLCLGFPTTLPLVMTMLEITGGRAYTSHRVLDEDQWVNKEGHAGLFVHGGLFAECFVGVSLEE